MKYKLLKDLPGYKAGEIISDEEVSKNNTGYIFSDYPDFFEPIVEKKTYDDLKEGDTVYTLDMEGKTTEWEFFKSHCRSELFLTREEAEDEHKRREFSVRPDRFIPDYKEVYFHPRTDGSVNSNINQMLSEDANNINLGLCFRTREECETAIKKHDLIRLFYQIR